MRVKNFVTIGALFLMVSIFTAGTVYSARTSEGDEITSSTGEEAASDQTPAINEDFYPPAIPASEQEVAPAAPERKAAGPGRNTSREKDDSRLISIDFDNVDINLLIKFISELTDKNFLVDPNVKGKVTIISPSKISVDEAYRVFESVLEVHGFTTVPSGSVTKIVSLTEARSKNIDTVFGDENVRAEDKLVTQIIPLKYANPKELEAVFKPLISKGSVMVSYDPTGMLILTETKSNISRLLKIIEVLDVPGTGEMITVIPLKNASAQTMATSIGTVFRSNTGTAKRTAASIAASQIIAVPDERMNAIILLASEVDTLKVKGLIDLLDREIPRGDGGIHVYPLQNADAEEMSKTLMSIPKETPKQGEQKGTAPVLSKDIQIVSDKATNSLIITAEKADYLILENVIHELDRPRSMVYIEALIMEVSMSNKLEIGVQWQVGDVGDNASVYSASNPGVNNFPSLNSDGSVSLPTGLTYGVLGNTIKIGGIDFADIGAVLRAYANDSDVQIHSWPQIMTLDNEEASLSVIDNVPYITRRDENTSTGTTGYSNYDFKDVGVKLTITPQINQERFVRLKIDQTVSQVLSTNEEGQPTTFERKANTVVRIKDGQTVVIGGLIDSKDNRTNYRVPLLSRVPILGYLFKSKTNSLDKKNLYIFITPRIVTNPGEATELYEEKKEHIRSIQQGSIRMNNDGKLSEDMRLAGIGYKYLELKDYEKALKYYEKALKENPNNPYAILNIGYINQVQGNSVKAIEMYEKLIAMAPKDVADASTDPLRAGKRLTDIATENLKSLKTNN
ncbi:MAG: type II secretion system secretin GspD [Deltaproteobacteria bacterium]|nr:type II secretion system secretin GspD [Deltaproteobacteria bacterium]